MYDDAPGAPCLPLLETWDNKHRVSIDPPYNRNLIQRSPKRSHRLIHPLIIGNLKDDPSRLLKSGLLVAIETAILLTQISIVHTSPDNHAQAMMTHWLSNLLGIVFWISLAITILMKYVDVMERNRDFGILRVLGASVSYILTYLLQETILESIPGALIGLAFGYIATEVFKALLDNPAAMSFPYQWWPAVTAIVISASLVGAILAIPKAIQEGLAETL
jgi:hypothetical protein